MELDPNVTYKTGFAELILKLGRTPTMKDAELLALHESYKRAWEPASEPGPPQRLTVAAAAPLSGPDKPAKPEAAVSEPEPVENKPAASERARMGGRGPGGGIVAVCEGCGSEWERPARRGRPARKCEECR